ncbi:hypothetical protein [Candidatus Magnetominusculus dajiuhuensis]|uniref:hypothetical protein n=1 Tax=Candidatus Magnetominusculus dajiuhuensis TaxID=3137712 RepID=UPI003B42FE6D
MRKEKYDALIISANHFVEKGNFDVALLLLKDAIKDFYIDKEISTILDQSQYDDIETRLTKKYFDIIDKRFNYHDDNVPNRGGISSYSQFAIKTIIVSIVLFLTLISFGVLSMRYINNNIPMITSKITGMISEKMMDEHFLRLLYGYVYRDPEMFYAIAHECYVRGDYNSAIIYINRSLFFAEPEDPKRSKYQNKLSEYEMKNDLKSKGQNNAK